MVSGWDKHPPEYETNIGWGGKLILLVWIVVLFLATMERVIPKVSATEIRATVSHIVDGDTFDLTAAGLIERIRLWGVDSPERGADGYQEAKTFLRDRIMDREIRCVRVDEGSVCDGMSAKTNAGRTIATCFLDDEDIGVILVRARHACDYEKHSGGYYQRVGVANVCVRRD